MKIGNDQRDRPLLLVFIIFLLTYSLSFIPKDLSIMGISLKQVNLLSALFETDKEAVNNNSLPEDEDEYDYLKEYQDLLQQDSTDNSNSSDSVKSFSQEPISVLKIESGALTASLTFFNGFEELLNEALNNKFDDYNNSGKVSLRNEKIIGNTEQMKYFYKSLKMTKSKRIRIAHFGDSGIEGDLISGELRYELQKQFGGKGVGWVSITSQDIQFRATTLLTFSNNWEEASVYTSNPKRLPLGISGEVFLPEGESWSQYITTRKFRTMKSFRSVRLFYSDAMGGSIRYRIDDGKSKSVKLRKGNDLNVIKIDDKEEMKKFRFETASAKQAYFYGVSLEDDRGIYLDNFPLRGNTGVDLLQIELEKLKQFSKKLHYKLIILQFGLNAAGSIRKSYGWYEKEMGKVIAQLRKAFPKTSILMISAQDKSKKKGSHFETDPVVFRLLKSQLKIMKDNNVAFWNMFEAMGGKNSMHNWVMHNPPLASHDHIHFNQQGAKKIASLLSGALLDGYQKYKK